MIRTVIISVYFMARSALRITGMINPARKIFGPLVGRMMFSTFGHSSDPVIVMGHKMFLASSGRYPPVMMLKGQYEQETTRLLQRIVEPGMSVMDVGAHVGYFTLMAAKAAGPGGKIYAFEPDPGNYALLVENARINGYENIEAIEKGVSHETGSSTLYVAGLDNGRNSLLLHDLPQAGTTTVETVSIDEFLDSLEWPQVDVVKIDVEGLEPFVWRGMKRLRQKEDDLKLILEFNPILLRSAGIDPLEFLSAPGADGFEVFWIDEERGLIPVGSTTQSKATRDRILRLEAREISVNLFCSKQ